MNTDSEPPTNTPSWLGIGAILAAVGASACCVGPFLLLSLGIGGAWISTLTALEPARPFFIVLTLILVGLGYRKLYLTPDRCAVGEICSTTDNQRQQRLLFWLGSAFILMLLAFPWVAPFFMA
ncbi:mercuric transporter MerT family protein [Methylomonas sp. SURF-1]|jgi:mercuric ion transport protein|nr:MULTISPECIES: mercuric transporter MerT family protein [unclassified Methylomonas]MCQ8105846.1 mercuric transporter MerT family protein [Methylomonas sp. SURF-2]MCQ8182678.1 mercuric transporter MerT family protein [Methylomonas sp. SURF-1]